MDSRPDLRRNALTAGMLAKSLSSVPEWSFPLAGPLSLPLPAWARWP
jgi:hypothetical protein